MNINWANIDWAALAPWILGGSVAMFLASLIVLPLLLISMPADYFMHTGRRFGWLDEQHPLVRLALLGIKNAVGLLLLIAGIIMLVTPGQGILAILIGICLTDLPGKRRLERALLRRPGILNTLNSVRTKFGKPPLEKPDGMDDERLP